MDFSFDIEFFDVLVCDEAHRLRKSSSIINRTILRSDIDRRWLLTGTPIEKNSLDVLNLASILEPSRISVTNTKFSDANPEMYECLQNLNEQNSVKIRFLQDL